MLRAARDCADTILGGIKSETGGKERNVCSADRSTKTLHWW